MKFKSLILAATAILALAACKKESVPMGLTVDGLEKTTFNVPVAGGSQVFKLSSSEAWTASSTKPWVTVSPASGAAGTADLTITVTKNEEKERSASVKITAGMFKATISVKQASDIPAGDGSKANPFSASEAHAWVMDNLENNAVTPTSQKFYVKGKIHKIKENSSFAQTADHKATFYISDDGNSSEDDFQAYQIYYLGQREWRTGDDDIKVGDDVVIYCQLKRYNTTAETGGSYDYMYSLNGETSGKAPAPDVSQAEAKTIAEFIALAKTDTYYKISGTVSSFQLEGNPTQCTLTDDSGSITMYGVDDMGSFANVKNDGILTIAAKYEKYVNKTTGKETHEAVDCIFISFVEGESVEAKGSGTLEDPYNPSGAIEYIKSLGDNIPSENEVYVKGKIASITNEFDKEHGTAVFLISEDGSMKTTFTCYSVKFLENKEWSYGNTQIKKGDEVIVKSKVTVYNGVYETLSDNKVSYKGYIYSLNGKTSETPGPYALIDKKEFAVADTETSVKVKVTSNSAWTVTTTSENPAVKANPASGNADAEVTLSFPANEDPDKEAVYTFTLACEAAAVSETITITQDKYVSPAEKPIVLTFPDDNKDNNKKGSYKCDWVAKIGDYSWNIVNFNNNSWNNNWAYIKTGWKTEALTSTITNAAAFESVIKSLTVSYDSFDAAVATSTTLYVASDKDFKNNLQTIEGKVTGKGDYTYTIPTPVANGFYKLEIVCVKASANGGIVISKLSYNK